MERRVTASFNLYNYGGLMDLQLIKFEGRTTG